jgi:hypothetical protein
MSSPFVEQCIGKSRTGREGNLDVNFGTGCAGNIYVPCRFAAAAYLTEENNNYNNNLTISLSIARMRALPFVISLVLGSVSS